MTSSALLLTPGPGPGPNKPDYELLPVNKDALVDKTRALLQEAIITGRIPQGHRINETLVANQLNVSRGPIREALAGLVTQGLVKKIANKGVFVIKLTPADVEELYALRSMYEVFALHYVLTHARPIHFDVLDEIVHEIGASVERRNAESEASAVDLRFHTELLKAAGLPRLTAAWEDLTPQLQILLYNRNSANSDFRVAAVQAHQPIVDAIRNNDRAAAELLLRDHIDQSYHKLMASLDKEV